MDAYQVALTSKKRCIEESNKILFLKAIEWVIKTGIRLKEELT